MTNEAVRPCWQNCTRADEEEVHVINVRENSLDKTIRLHVEQPFHVDLF